MFLVCFIRKKYVTDAENEGQLTYGDMGSRLSQ